MSEKLKLADELESIRKRGHFPDDSLIEDVVAALRSSAVSDDAAIAKQIGSYLGLYSIDAKDVAYIRGLLNVPQSAQDLVDWDEMPQTRRLLSIIKQGVECTFDDSQVAVFISDESDPSVGLDGGIHLSLSCNYEIIPLSLLNDIKLAMGDNWERCLDLWRQTYEVKSRSQAECAEAIEAEQDERRRVFGPFLWDEPKAESAK